MPLPHRDPGLRLLVVPGLHDSGPAHWQSWLESLNRDAVRVKQKNWAVADADRWAARIASTIEPYAATRWLVAGHSFGCLAVARLAALRPDLPIEAALLVAPADPDRFGAAESMPLGALPFSATLVASQNDPWFALRRAQTWAQRWRSHFVDLGPAGHINAESGFGPLPLAQRWVVGMRQRVERERRAENPTVLDCHFAI